VCHGLDGEGCDHTVTADEAGWEHIGTADRIEFEL
jgi:hypothetical protein